MFGFKKISQFKKGMRSIVLGATQKDTTKQNIVAYMHTHPVRKNISGRLKSQNRGNILFFNTEHMYAKIATLLILLSGTGTAFAAENTLPGDALYPVKIHVNEPVREALSVSGEAKANWNAEVAERRLDEASRLAAKGTLSTTTEANIEARFTEQTEKVKAQIAKLQAAGKTEVASNLSTRLESAIQIHTQILDKINIEDEDGAKKQDLKPLLQQLKSNVQSIHDVKVKLEDEVKAKHGPDVKVAAQNHMEMAAKQIASVQAFLDSKNVTVTSSAEVKLAAAQKTFDEGKTQFEAGNYNAAFLSFGVAQRLAAEARVMVHVENDLKIDERVRKIFDHISDKGVELENDQKAVLEEALKDKIEGNIKTKVEDKFKKRIENFKENHENTNLKVNTTNTLRLDIEKEKDNDDIKIL